MTKNRLPKTLRVIIATAVGLVSLGVGQTATALPSATTSPLAATTHSSVALETAADSDVTVEISQSASFIGATDAMTLTVSVENSSEAPLAAGTLVVESGTTPIDSRQALTDWSDGTGASTSDRPLATVSVPAIDAGARHTASPIIVSTELLGLAGQAGAYPLDATYTSTEVTASSFEAIVFTPDAGANSLGVAVAAPITAPSTTTGLLSAEALSVYTAPTGLLTRQLDGLIDRPVALGIDPMIIASIRALGSAAPASAVNWLDRLSRATNETFPLQYADADASAQAQAGLPGLLNPTSLLFGLDPENFTEDTAPDATDEPGPTPTAPASPAGDPEATPSPTPTPGEPTLPTLAELTEWTYTTTGIVWPDDDSVVAADVPVFTASGATTTILSSGNVTTKTGYSAGASANVGDASVLLSDAAASASLRRAATAISTEEQLDALADLAGQLMVIASESDAPARTLLLTLDREWPPTGSRLSDAITSLMAMPTVSSSVLSAAVAEEAVAATIVDQSQSPERLALVKRLNTRESSLEGFSTMLDDPALLTGQERAEILALLGVSWRSNPDEWTDAAAEHDATTTETLESVGIAATSPILMVSNQSSLPFSVRNEFDLPVTVVLQASSSSLKLNVDSSVTQVIPPNARETVRVPVEARLGNGEVTVRLQLYSPSGELVGESGLVPVTVRADWEGIGAAGLSVLIALLFVVGLVRTVRKRRAERRERDQTDEPIETDAAAATPTSTPGNR
ncbi:hypothetical protein IWX78_000579 [Mycetocola sp. CAN_C7]|uniref:DUF6049 family protein n=1 Tax=Mycetocola sp. CAN_C7 TaxID=2787724 RepID=UPI0018CB391B